MAELIEAVRAQGLEGVVAKRRASPYRSGDRSGDWLKLRLNQGLVPVLEDEPPQASVCSASLLEQTGFELPVPSD